MTKYALAAMLALGLMGVSSGVRAEGLRCALTSEALAGAKEHYGEVPAFSGATSNGALVTITVSPKGSWTMWLALPPDKLCMLAAGEMVKPEEAKPEEAKPNKLPAAPALLPNGLRLI